MSELFKFPDKEVAEVFDMEVYRKRTEDKRWADPADPEIQPDPPLSITSRVIRGLTQRLRPGRPQIDQLLEPYSQVDHTPDVTPITNPTERIDDWPPPPNAG
ncbi:MAG TPA: hypothetical protein VLF39_03060 [Candidatus Saccharimonadales bacterium]|nr:hypothetical protein [Candidatus Saccharimonadales bacterium]